jgi:hypothetical protein
VTNSNVLATISFNKSEVIITNNSGGTHYLFTGNDSFTFTYRDSAGTTGSLTATVNRIDKTPPFATALTYTPATLTS